MNKVTRIQNFIFITLLLLIMKLMLGEEFIWGNMKSMTNRS